MILRILLTIFVSATLALSADQAVSDDEIHDRVRLKLVSDRDVKGGAFEVEVHDGVVTLRGKVERERYKEKAAKLAKKVKGVKSVVNELTVEKPGAAPRP